MTKEDINKDIKKKLREATKKLNAEIFIQVFDLEAKFVRAPLDFIMNKVSNMLTKIMKQWTENESQKIA